MLISSTTQTSLQNRTDGLGPQETTLPNIRERIISTAMECMRTLVKDNHARMSNYNKDNDLLAKGFFYPNEYCMVLTETGNKTRLEFLKKNGSFFHGFMSPKYFTLQDTTDRALVTGKIPMTFMLKNHAKPSEALASTHTGVSLIGCGEACDIAFYESILQLWGKDKFDALLAKEGSAPFCIVHQNRFEDPLSTLFLREIANPNLDQIQKGQLIHISSAEMYTAKHPFGEEQGINLICIDDTAGSKRFIGLGTSPEGISYETACKWLFDAYNKKPIAIEQIVSEEYALKDLEYRIQGISVEIQGADKDALMSIFSFIEKTLHILFSQDQIMDLINKPREAAKLLFQAQLAYKQNQMILTWEEFLKQGGGTIKQVTELKYQTIEILHGQSIAEAQKTLQNLKSQAIANLKARALR